tara:strand:+ start:2224 stop:2604 length:381 start_codon:yes stop_codon:yes gene_type:complete
MDFNELSPQMRGAKTRLLNQLEKRLKIAALQMEGRSKQVAFSRFNNQTGRLRQSIAGRFAIVDGKPTAILQAGGQFGGAELNYARFIEFGTRYIKPRRFLGRSIEAQQKQFQPKLQDLLRAALIKE